VVAAGLLRVMVSLRASANGPRVSKLMLCVLTAIEYAITMTMTKNDGEVRRLVECLPIIIHMKYLRLS
jgi:hypothetical protein